MHKLFHKNQSKLKKLHRSRQDIGVRSHAVVVFLEKSPHQLIFNQQLEQFALETHSNRPTLIAFNTRA